MFDQLCQLLERRASGARAHLFCVRSQLKLDVKNTHFLRGTVSPKSHGQIGCLTQDASGCKGSMCKRHNP